MRVWVAFHRGEFFGESEPPGPPSFVGAYATREEALKHCWPPGDDRWIQEAEVLVADPDRAPEDRESWADDQLAYSEAMQAAETDRAPEGGTHGDHD